MKIKSIKGIFLAVLAICFSICLLFIGIVRLWIAHDVKSQCRGARIEYGGDCVEALLKLLDDENKGFHARNSAIWALGQLSDSRALPALNSYFTGNIPPRESLDRSISQYELNKAINLISERKNGITWVWRDRLSRGAPTAGQEIRTETVVVCQTTDPYYSLAQQIAQEESLEIVEEFEDVLKISPRFVILVSSPNKLTAKRLTSIGRLFQNRNYYPGLGIISGSTLEKAGQLWARRDLVKGGNNYLGSDVDILQRIYEPAIYDLSDNSHEKLSLNKGNLIDTLKQADYFYWVRHSGAQDWSWNEEYGNWSRNDQLLVNDIPELKPAVIYNLACNSFRPWMMYSLAIGFVDRGAAAYLGLVNSPHMPAFLRNGLSVPGITSWSEFPLGLVAQIQNKVAARTVFSSPQLFMLGDPRIYLSKDPPYQITSDRVINDGKRIITGVSDERGILAVKINGGAKYSYLSVKGLTSVSESDLFYNHKLQALNLGGDKYVLFLHHGGSFEIKLLTQSPLGWKIADTLVDAFDFSWAMLWLSTYPDSNPYTLLISLPIFTGIILFKTLKQKKSIKSYSRIFLFALLFAFIHLAYFLWRWDDYTVSTNLAIYTPFQITIGGIGSFAGVAGGLILMRDSTKPGVKLLGLLFAVLRQFWAAGFYLVFITLLNTTTITRSTETWLLNYDAFWLALIVLAFEMIAVSALYRHASANQRLN